MSVKTKDELNNIDEMIKLVDVANKELRKGEYPHSEIMMEIVIVTTKNNGTIKITKFSLSEKNRRYNGCRVANGVTWNSFLENIKFELGNRFYRQSGLQNLSDLDYIIGKQKTDVTQKEDPDFDLDESDIDDDYLVDDDDLDDPELDLSLDESDDDNCDDTDSDNGENNSKLNGLTATQLENLMRAIELKREKKPKKSSNK